jgi:cyclic pyranopterin monophosphate synthase
LTKKLTHIDARGAARMVDVGDKPVTDRAATAEAIVTMDKSTIDLLTSNKTPKGDVLATARIAGIMAAKRTPELIPLCHAIALAGVTVDLTIDKSSVRIVATARAHDKTGVEMEALTAASVAALTVYDMLKSVDRGMHFRVGLVDKSGGRSGHWRREKKA